MRNKKRAKPEPTYQRVFLSFLVPLHSFLAVSDNPPMTTPDTSLPPGVADELQVAHHIARHVAGDVRLGVQRFCVGSVRDL